MKKSKLLLALAMVFVALSFSLNAKAQSDVPVFVTYTPSGSYGCLFDIYLQNNVTNEWYNLWTNPSTKDDYNTYRCGYVPAGNYSVHFRRILGPGNDGRYNWYAKNQSAYNVLLNNGDFTQLTSSIDINDDWYNNDYGLTITVEDW